MIKDVKEIVNLLNDLIKSEFTTINQYWLYGLTLGHDGLDRLSKKFIEESVEEREHVSAVAARILQLGGNPVFGGPDVIKNTENVEEMLKSCLVLEEKIISQYNDAITKISSLNDHATADMLTEILCEEEEHKEWLTAQIEIIKKIGYQLYVAKLIEFCGKCGD
jgi:bacterioferritin